MGGRRERGWGAWDVERYGGRRRESPGRAGAFGFARAGARGWDDPDGIRTRVAALKGPCPRPLDDGAAMVPG